MKELIKSILILAKAIFDDENQKKGSQRIGSANFFTHVFSVKKDDLFLRIEYDWSGRLYDDYKDLYRYRLIVDPQDWDSNKSICLTYDIKKDFFRCQCIYTESGASRKYDNKAMLKHINDVLKCIAEKRRI